MSQDAAARLEGLTTDLQATQADLEAAFAEVRSNGLTDEDNKALLRRCIEAQQRQINVTLRDINGIASGLVGGRGGKGRGKG